MPAVCFYFQVHQPLRIKKYRVFDVGNEHQYFNDQSECNLNNYKVLEKVARKSYLPTNKLLLKLLNKHPEFKVSFSLSGILLEQLEKDFPRVLDSFRALVDTGRVEILSETYYHTLAFIYSKSEFSYQVKKHNINTYEENLFKGISKIECSFDESKCPKPIIEKEKIIKKEDTIIKEEKTPDLNIVEENTKTIKK